MINMIMMGGILRGKMKIFNLARERHISNFILF